MTQDEIIRMALESGLGEPVNHDQWDADLPRLEHFAALVAAHEREKALKKEYGVPDTVSPLDFVVGSVKQAVLAEREACAKVCDEPSYMQQRAKTSAECAAAIRARGE